MDANFLTKGTKIYRFELVGPVIYICASINSASSLKVRQTEKKEKNIIQNKLERGQWLSRTYTSLLSGARYLYSISRYKHTDTSKIRLSDAMETTEQSPVIMPSSITTPASLLATANPELSPQTIIMNRSQPSLREMAEKKISCACAPTQARWLCRTCCIKAWN